MLPAQFSPLLNTALGSKEACENEICQLYDELYVVCPQVSLVLSALQAGNKGTQACITAANAVSGIIADLDTTIMFASAGTLNAENEESFADHR